MLSRHLVSNRLAAAVGGWFCGFSPAMLSHANWHPNIISQFLLPFIVWRVLMLTRSTRPVRDGALLALLVTVQAFINEEILLFTALACGVFLFAVVVQQRERWAGRVAAAGVGLAVCAVLAGALLAYPLWVQFAGPMAYHGLSDAVRDYGNDIAAFFTPGSPTLGGNERANANWPRTTRRRTRSSAGAAAGRRHRGLAAPGGDGPGAGLHRPAVRRALARMASGSPGGTGRVSHRAVKAWLVRLPLLDAVVTDPLVLVLIPVIGAADRAVGGPGDARRASGHHAWPVGSSGSAWWSPRSCRSPRPRCRSSSVPPTPVFFTSGEWRSYVPAGRSVVTVPLTGLEKAIDGMQWADDVHIDFAQAGGYFLGPDPSTPEQPGAVRAAAPADRRAVARRSR